MIKILGIDQSLTSSGWCLTVDGEPKKYGLITSNKNLSNYIRSINIADEIDTLVQKVEPDMVVIEGLPFMSRSNVTRDLAGLQFVIYDRLLLSVDEENILVIPPTKLKKFASGTGKASKEEMFEALPSEIRNSFGQTPKSRGRFDLTDSYWLSKFGEYARSVKNVS